MTDSMKLYRDVTEAGLDDWRMLARGIHARFTTGSFAKGLSLVAAIGEVAESANHHPDVTLTYPRVDVKLMSHDVGHVTQRDLDSGRADQRGRAWPRHRLRPRLHRRRSRRLSTPPPRPRSSRSGGLRSAMTRSMTRPMSCATSSATTSTCGSGTPGPSPTGSAGTTTCSSRATEVQGEDRRRRRGGRHPRWRAPRAPVLGVGRSRWQQDVRVHRGGEGRVTATCWDRRTK
ncbi:4a-hydroxytetrahydrobiopterin dehydratase [Nocardioides sp. B-3]|uniref:4a-hydroxytetrahydrobiopterin dehydratase n=1 Tax=Nocardioides sp. B-3 TaxID=2895565 RepID=UPI002152B4A9|nr:4a-hydroxytetrahydrobiopterin dehydratase [Nocardioides sp. B-3]UUZ59964.1 4a-hydroxytetrahydrobiopterin dehydratase [Nocardioides sp. B-3]